MDGGHLEAENGCKSWSYTCGREGETHAENHQMCSSGWKGFWIKVNGETCFSDMIGRTAKFLEELGLDLCNHHLVTMNEEELQAAGQDASPLDQLRES